MGTGGKGQPSGGVSSVNSGQEGTEENISLSFSDFSEWVKSEKLERQNLSCSF